MGSILNYCVWTYILLKQFQADLEKMFVLNKTILSRDVATLGGTGRLRPALEPTTQHSERFKVFRPALNGKLDILCILL